MATDETPEQTQAILRRIASGSGTDKTELIIQKHHAIQRILRQRAVVVPFASRLAELFPSIRPEARRAFGQLLQMVRASALLHHFQRDADAEGRIVATLADYEIARRLLNKPLARSLGNHIHDGAIRFHRFLHDTFGVQIFSTTEASLKSGKTRQTVSDYLWELNSVGAVSQYERGTGCKPATWQLETEKLDGLQTSLLPVVAATGELCPVDGKLTQKPHKHREKQQKESVSGGNLGHEERTIGDELDRIWPPDSEAA